MTDDITAWDATRLAAATRAGELSAREVVTAHLDRIEALNPDVNALVAMRPRGDILAEAAELDTLPPEARGPLHGLPVAVKDLEDVAGLPTRMGSLATPETPAAADGIMAERQRRAGAVIVGKTNTPEFGTGSHTFNEVYGVTRNPWNLDRTAGGSSGGAAAALAARMLPLADGSDLGGSLRNPAAFCNVVGLRPGIGRVPERCPDSTHLLRLGLRGPMARTVADVGLFLSALAGPAAEDPMSIAEDPAGFAAPMGDQSTATVGWVGDLDAFRCEPPQLEIARDAAGRIAGAGGTLVDHRIDLSSSMRVFRVFRGLGYRRLGSLIVAEDRPLLKDTVRENIAFGEALGVDDVLEAEVLRARIHHEMRRAFEEVDVIALPTTQVAPFPVELEYPIEVDGVAMGDYLEWMTSCCIITPTACPAISIPAGFTADGLPVGLQLVAPVGAERRLLEIAHAIEQQDPVGRRVPALG